VSAEKLKASAEARALRGRLSEVIGALFDARGYLRIDPPILQPADVFLDLMGEAMRADTYVFADPDGVEICLRPDLTIAACRLYLESGVAPKEARLWYDGAVYRHVSPQSGLSHEIHHAGVERLGAADREAADAEVLTLVLDGLRAAGTKDARLKLGDLGLFSAFADTLDLPEQWRGRLRQHLTLPADFKRLLARLAGKGQLSEGPKALISALGRLSETEARAVIEDVLALSDIQPMGGRSAEEIAERFLEQAADASALDMKRETVRLIETFQAIKGTPEKALAALRRLAKGRGKTFEAAIARFERRLSLIAGAGVDLQSATFETTFERRMRYYTGFIFGLEVGPAKSPIQVASGGRYDRLLTALGAKREISAVGAAIFLDSLMRIGGSGR
jgi:ATP phosphoribosyltransferase regulatory subunit